MPEQTRSLFLTSRIIRGILACIAILLTLVVIYASYLFWLNNRSVAAPSPQAISDSLEKGIAWLANNRKKVLSENKPMLWWMISRSADITRDERLNSLFSEYKSRYLDPFPGNPWWYLFDPQSKTPVSIEQLIHLPDYNKYFIYGASCSPVLAQDETIRRQSDSSFCPTYHPISPACITHQLIGAQFIRERGCPDDKKIQVLIEKLQSRIFTQLTWDPRVVDVYIQRVLMLTQSGDFHRVKPVWLQRVLNAQSIDGGWDNFHPVFPISPSRSVGFAGNGIGVRQSEGGSDLHATAQGVFLMSLVANGTYKGLGKQ